MNANLPPTDPHGYRPIFAGFIAAVALALFVTIVGIIATVVPR